MTDAPGYRMTARDKVLGALHDTLLRMPECTVYLNRFSALEVHERPGVVIKAMDEVWTNDSTSEMLRTLSVEIDFYEEAVTFDGDEVFGGISSRQGLMLAQAESLLLEGNQNLGGIAEDVQLRGVSGDPDQTPDFGCVTMLCEITYRTPYGDPWTVLGAGQTY